MSPFMAAIPKVLEFLTRCSNQIKTYGTLNSYRSAVALIVSEEIGQNLVKNPVKRFLRGTAQIQLQNRKHEEIWDPDLVFS